MEKIRVNRSSTQEELRRNRKKNYWFIISALGSAYINDYEKYTKETFYLLNYLSEINFD
jgi:hypothetical protein